MFSANWILKVRVILLFSTSRLQNSVPRTLRAGWSSHQVDMPYVLVPSLLAPPLKSLDINRLLHPAQPLSSPEDSANLPDPRILILSVSPDASNSYIPIMNSIFSAQKLVSSSLLVRRQISLTFTQKITIDVCKIFGPDSVFLQQAAYLTGGSYIYLEHREALLQYLIVCSLLGVSCAQLTNAL